jgi:hypothetical protein
MAVDPSRTAKGDREDFHPHTQPTFGLRQFLHIGRALNAIKEVLGTSEQKDRRPEGLFIGSY